MPIKSLYSEVKNATMINLDPKIYLDSNISLPLSKIEVIERDPNSPAFVFHSPELPSPFIKNNYSLEWFQQLNLETFYKNTNRNWVHLHTGNDKELFINLEYLKAVQLTKKVKGFVMELRIQQGWLSVHSNNRTHLYNAFLYLRHRFSVNDPLHLGQDDASILVIRRKFVEAVRFNNDINLATIMTTEKDSIDIEYSQRTPIKKDMTFLERDQSYYSACGAGPLWYFLHISAIAQVYRTHHSSVSIEVVTTSKNRIPVLLTPFTVDAALAYLQRHSRAPSRTLSPDGNKRPRNETP